ncbi:MAG TPA: DUF3182 family protein [Casimicrobiaceae bacterium]|nr:DUF3182 family protein [Casimicrobiaceae bacterium]
MPPAGVVYVHRGTTSDRAAHDHATCTEIARRLAALKGYRFAGDYDESASIAGDRYFVPTDTLIGTHNANALGIRGEHDLFGGVAPHPFVATKSISHPLVDDAKCIPQGWSTQFAIDTPDAVLAGFAAFCLDDALRAGERLLALGPVRIKRALGIGGSGQTVAPDRDTLAQALADVDPDELAQFGIALEQDLRDVTTRSIGQVRIDEIIASYCGTQRLVLNNAGEQVYGGSDLLVARGDFDALLELDHAPHVRQAIEQARAYDAAAFRCFAGLFASRRNYDVAQGCDARGNTVSGVLEQSWRVGGASGAEVEALAAFRADPALHAVRATSTEAYGTNVAVPAHAVVYYEGVDDRAGPLTKYTVVEAHGDAR